MTNTLTRSLVLLATVGGLSAPWSASAQGDNPLSGLLMPTGCSPDELGRVTQAKLLTPQQANAIFKKGNAPQIAKRGEAWVQIFARSRANPDSYTLTRTDRAPTPAELAAVVGKPTCTY